MKREKDWQKRIAREGRSLGVLIREVLPEIKADIESLKDKAVDVFYKLPESEQEGELGARKIQGIDSFENAIAHIDACINDLLKTIM